MSSSNSINRSRGGEPINTVAAQNKSIKGHQDGITGKGSIGKRRVGNSVMLEGKKQRPKYGGHERMWAEIVTIQEDYLSCKVWYPASDETGADIDVAKPYLLQQAPFDGETIAYQDGDSITYTKDATDPEWKRDHDDGTNNADHVITPNYYVGEKIVIFKIPTNVTVSGTRLFWMELGLGRYWARVIV